MGVVMICGLTGSIIEKRPDFAALDVNGVIYGINIPLTTYQSLNGLHEKQTLHTYLIHREDRMELYGFKDRENLEIFELLISLQGIGPKLAIVLLSNLTPDDLRKHVQDQNIDRLKRISGIGPKKAEKILFELKGKLGPARISTDHPAADTANDLYLALISLGYTSAEAEKAVRNPAVTSARTLEEKIREALRTFG
jgi:holliday junction DNA helicase RuvA